MHYAIDNLWKDGALRLFDAYSAAREAAAALLRRAGIASAQDEDLRACAEGYELSSALAQRLGIAPEKCLLAVRAAEAEAPALLCGAKMCSEAVLRGGHICFALTDAAYTALIHAVMNDAQLPALPEDTERLLPYAVARMRMLARKESAGCPDSTEVRRALWLCFGIAEAGLSCRELQARAARAARAVLAIGRGMPARERAELLSRCGDVGGCAARLLAYALGRAGTKPDFIES